MCVCVCVYLAFWTVKNSARTHEFRLCFDSITKRRRKTPPKWWYYYNNYHDQNYRGCCEDVYIYAIMQVRHSRRINSQNMYQTDNNNNNKKPIPKQKETGNNNSISKPSCMQQQHIVRNILWFCYYHTQIYVIIDIKLAHWQQASKLTTLPSMLQ